MSDDLSDRDWIENLDIKVQIKNELRTKLIFGLQARPPIGLILGFLGYRHEVMHLMQTISHGTWAFIFNAAGLVGFVDRFEIMFFLY